MQYVIATLGWAVGMLLILPVPGRLHQKSIVSFADGKLTIDLKAWKNQ